MKTQVRGGVPTGTECTVAIILTKPSCFLGAPRPVASVIHVSRKLLVVSEYHSDLSTKIKLFNQIDLQS